MSHLSDIFNMDIKSSNKIHSDKGVRPLSTVLRTLEVVDYFAGRSRPARLTEIASALNLSRATAYQRAFTLLEAGWLEQDEDGRYRLSMLATRVAAAALEQADLGARSGAVLSELTDRTGKTASLCVMHRGEPSIVARVESESLLRAEQKIGTGLSLEGSASGRVLVAFADEVTVERMQLRGSELPTEDVLRQVRQNGYAVSSGQVQTGVLAIAAPVFDVHGKCCAALSLVGPSYNFDTNELFSPLIDAANRLTDIYKGSSGTS
ncbi:IclR family transcriptional regulator [Halomonas neptunia]|uniref:IclR family transcriptional regulator n=1 Tax=Vreelandella neptunia TaxID=115551 RepID=A0ABS9SCM9_9GAMM|nr:IclR family transcriptional regulator [Halomonas neptunia]